MTPRADDATSAAVRLPVPAGLFAPHRPPPFALYDAIDDRVEVDAYWLDDCAGETVTLSPADAPAFRTYLRVHLPDILQTEAVPRAQRAWAAHRALLHELTILLATPDARANALVDACRGLAGLLAGFTDPEEMFRSLRVDAPYAPVVHGVETAIGAVALAVAHGERSVAALTMIATAGALADIGMRDLPRDLRDRHEDLTPVEARELRRHPDLSVRRLNAYRLGMPPLVRAVAHHHERWDGEGYPSRLIGDAIPIEARYVAVADAYSALTVARPGRSRLSRGDALRQMAGSSGQFDPTLLRLLVRLLAPPEVRAALESKAA